MDVANYKKDDTTNDYYKIYGDIPELTDISKEKIDLFAKEK